MNLASAVDHLEFTNIDVAAQNVHQAEAGAFTGEISADMLKSVGVNTVILTVTDNNNNVATTTAVVTVEDSVLPIITCTTDKVVTTTANVCIYTHNNSSWNATAIDVCGSVSSLTYALSGSTTLANAPANTSLNSQLCNKGITTVTWTAFDDSLNQAQCSFTVTVKDEQKPNAICQNITIQLNAFGNASITVNDIDAFFCITAVSVYFHHGLPNQVRQ